MTRAQRIAVAWFRQRRISFMTMSALFTGACPLHTPFASRPRPRPVIDSAAFIEWFADIREAAQS